jgi:curved DNA-binding protein CbpA
MSRQEALQVLGLDASATQDDVRREYRRLIKKLHPDLGGSSYLAAKLNEAKDVLL